jgi:hypothetical protein
MMDLSLGKHSPAESRVPPVGLFGVRLIAEPATTTQAKQLSFSVAALLGSTRRRDEKPTAQLSPPPSIEGSRTIPPPLRTATPSEAEEEETQRRRRLGQDSREYERFEEEEEEDEDISVDSSDHEAADSDPRQRVRHLGREEEDEDDDVDDDEEEEDEEGAAVSPPPSALHHPHPAQPLHFNPHHLQHHPLFHHHHQGQLTAPDGGQSGPSPHKWPPGIFPPGFNCLNQALFKSGN